MDMDRLISNVLRIGVVLSLILIIIGTLLLFVNNGSSGFPLSEIINVNSKINSSQFSLSDIINGIASFQGINFILLGIVVLVITPIARVVCSIFAFLYESYITNLLVINMKWKMPLQQVSCQGSICGKQYLEED